MQNERITSSLIEFSVENFGCFRDKVTFSMATRADAKNTFHLKKTDDHLLKTSIIYGANASGKSTLIKAMQFVKNKILFSSDEIKTSSIPFKPFLLQEGFLEKNTNFEMTFVLQEKVFRYAFSIDRNNVVVFENLVEIQKKTEDDIFVRYGNLFSDCASGFEEEALQRKTKEKALYLSVCSQWNVPLASTIFSFFANNLNFIDAHNTNHLSGFVSEKSEKDISFKNKLVKIMKKFDFSFTDFKRQSREKSIREFPTAVQEMLEKKGGIPLNGKLTEISDHFFHDFYDAKDKKISQAEIPYLEQSGGTRKLFEELGPILDTLETGEILIIDELNTSLHPTLLKAVVDLFHSEETNPHNAQLIFTTHETSLLAYAKEEIDRDQFWFTERDNYGRATLFSLAEFKERKDSANIDKKYLKGAYGAIPFINNIDPSLLSE